MTMVSIGSFVGFLIAAALDLHPGVGLFFLFISGACRPPDSH